MADKITSPLISSRRKNGNQLLSIGVTAAFTESLAQHSPSEAQLRQY
ncbi:hypothetical protein [Nostoc sp.]